MADTYPVGRREFLGTTAGCLAGAALSGVARPFATTFPAKQPQARGRRPVPWVSSDVATLRRVIISPPDRDQGLNLAGGRPDFEPWVDREAWLRDYIDGCPKTHEGLRAAGIDVQTFPGANLRRGYGGPHCLTLPLERG